MGTTMQEIGKHLILIGLGVIGLGILVMVFVKVPFLGKLPGDIMIKRENFSFYFPLTTCIILSIVFTLVMMLFKRH